MSSSKLETNIIRGSNLCEVCLDRAHKYKCPRCLLKTCSLECVKKHKTENACNGERNKTAYTAVRNFTDITLLSDYRFLEDAGRKADEASRERPQKGSARHVHRFSQQVSKRGVHLKTMPYPMSKRRQNSSYYNYKRQFVMWHTEWLFPQADAHYTRRAHEDLTVEDCLQGYLDSDKAEVRHKLRPYVRAAKEDIKVFMKKVDTPAHIQRYYDLPLESSIAACLKGRVVIEFPSFYVVLRKHWDNYILAEDSEKTHQCNSSEGMMENQRLTLVTPQAVYPAGFSKESHKDSLEENDAHEVETLVTVKNNVLESVDKNRMPESETTNETWQSETKTDSGVQENETEVMMPQNEIGGTHVV